MKIKSLLFALLFVCSTVWANYTDDQWETISEDAINRTTLQRLDMDGDSKTDALFDPATGFTWGHDIRFCSPERLIADPVSLLLATACVDGFALGGRHDWRFPTWDDYSSLYAAGGPPFLSGLIWLVNGEIANLDPMTARAMDPNFVALAIPMCVGTFEPTSSPIPEPSSFVMMLLGLSTLSLCVSFYYLMRTKSDIKKFDKLKEKINSCINNEQQPTLGKHTDISNYVADSQHGWPDVFITGEFCDRSDIALCADGIMAWACCMSGSKPPPKFGYVMAEICMRLKCSASIEGLKKYADEHGYGVPAV